MDCNHIERIEIVPWVGRGQGYCLVNGLLEKKTQSYPRYNIRQSLKNDTHNCFTTQTSSAFSGSWYTPSVLHRDTGRKTVLDTEHRDRAKNHIPPFSLDYALANDDSNSIGKVRIQVCVRSPHGIQHLWSVQHFSSPGQEPASAAGGLSTSQAENDFNYWRNSCCSRRHWWSQSLLQELLELSKKLACGPMAQLFGVTLLFKHRALI